MQIHNKKNKVLCVITTLVFTLSLCAMFTPMPKSHASEYPVISSMDDFYECLSKQIYAHEAVKNYTVKDWSLIKTIMDFSYDDYGQHYNSSSPMTSGCYLAYYVSSIYFSARNTTLKMTIIFPYTAKEMKTHFEKMTELSKTLRGDSEFDTVLNVHDYLLENFEYDPLKEKGNHTDIEGFRDGVMVCTGYSLAAYAILNEAGVATRVVTGYGGPGESDDNNHMWNLVRVDGNWYNMDATWDDGQRKKVYKYFLKSDADFPEHIRLKSYSNPGITAIISKTSYKLPARLRPGSKSGIWLGIMVGLSLYGIIQVLAISRKKKNAPVVILSEEEIPGLDAVTNVTNADPGYDHNPTTVQSYNDNYPYE